MNIKTSGSGTSVTISFQLALEILGGTLVEKFSVGEGLTKDLREGDDSGFLS